MTSTQILEPNSVRVADSNSFPESVERWCVLRTAARWEKKLATLLADLNISTYLPLMSRLTRYEGKKRTTQVPLFGGYLFCSESDYLGSTRLTPGIRNKVAQILRPSDPLLLRSELSALADLLTDRHLVQERLTGGIGESVRIIGGALVGYQGRIIRVKPNRWQLVLEISFLGARLEVEVDERQVERVVE